MSTRFQAPRRVAHGRTGGLGHLPDRDGLTGLPNRSQLAHSLEAALERAGANPVVLLSIDIDDFKLVNDGLGHAAGDALLTQVAARLRSVARPQGVLARQGSDEFLLLVELEAGADPAAAASRIGDRIADVLEAPFRIAGAEFRIGASVGAARYPADADDAASLHRRADVAMCRAREHGGGFALFQPGGADPLSRLATAAALRRGLLGGAVHVHYQPIYRLPSCELVGLEVLARWDDPERGSIPPDEFIPIAEKTGVIHSLGDWVLHQTCRDIRAWEVEGLYPNVGINVSPRQLQRSGFAHHVTRTVADYGIDPQRIVIELTESAWALEASRTLPVLEQLTDAGFVLALDDFGAGYSSLSRLRRLPVSIIKVDRSFMNGLPDDPEAVAIVEAILALANACGCDVVSEGVETGAQLEFLRSRGCRLAQGYNLGRPQPVQQLIEVLRSGLAPSRRLAS